MRKEGGRGGGGEEAGGKLKGNTEGVNRRELIEERKRNRNCRRNGNGKKI